MEKHIQPGTKNMFRHLIILFLIAAFGLSACFPFLPSRQDDSANAIYTAAAETVMAQMTLSAGGTAVARLTEISQATATPVAVDAQPTNTAVSPSDTAWPTPTETSWPTATFTTWPSPTNTLLPTATATVPVVYPTYLPTATSAPCNWAQFVKDVTIPDGTVLAPGQAFTKTWRLRNIGSCTWAVGYSLVFHSGDRLHTQSTVKINQTIYPGQTADLSLQLVAPIQPGQYRSYWMLSNTTGQLFGIGAKADRPFWVDIKVGSAPSPYALDFVEQMCAAKWSSTLSNNLPCPGNSSSKEGSIIRLNEPWLETGKLENEPALWTRPARLNDGYIAGLYPAYKVQMGDRFTADIGCLFDSPGCDVTFYLSYVISGQNPQDIAWWREVQDGTITRVNLDLSFLAGQSVQFILRVVNNGVAANANAFWLVPSIRR
jgi:hypothetical protein